MNDEKQVLRQRMRALRQAVPLEESAKASQSLLDEVKQKKLFEPYQHIAFYAAGDGEIDPELLLQFSWQLKKSCYLPVIPRDSNKMHFIQVEPQQALTHNHYGIPEPSFDPQREILPQQLDLVLVPLVAFDKTGHRLGRGKGYYDQCFSFLKNRSVQKPFLMGLAYQLQYVESLPISSHDVPLNAVLTEKRVYEF